MKNVVIFGASGHGSVVLDCLERENNFNIIGFVDSFKKKGDKWCGYEILGSEYDLPLLMDKFNIYGGIVAIGDNWTRKIIVDRISRLAPDFSFITVIHPSATIGRDVIIGKGTVVMPGAIINANSTIGEHALLNTNSSLGHDGQMNHYSSLASGVCVGGNLKLGAFSAIGLGANVIENVTIEEHAVIGAGSLVLNDISSHTVVYGSPATIIRKRKVGESYLSRNQSGSVIPFLVNNG